MGAESSALRGFTLQDPPWRLPSGLCIYPAALRDGRPASVFIYQPESSGTVHTAAQHLKTLRHPCLLRFLSCTVEVDGIHLVTERVQPLEMVLESLSSDEICSGIYDILQALVFLHDTGHSAHNNVCLSSVFVSEDGHWKLGGMEMVSKLTEAAPEFAEFGILPEAHGHARDAYSFGKMVESLLPYMTDQGSADLVSRFQSTVSSTLLNPDPSCRPSLCSLLSHEFFRNDFLEVVNFLKCLTVKSEEEKNEFFKFLLDRVFGLPEQLIISRLVPLLLNQLVFAEPAAVNSFLPHLLRPKKDTSGKGHSDFLLSPAIYQDRVIPLLLKLFKVHEEHVRMVLLTHIDAYGGLFSKEDLKNEILPQVLLGLRDINDSMVAMTLHSLAVLVSLLGPEVVIGGGRTKIFKSTTPSFTKTTDTTPEDSPIHINHIMQINQPMKHNFANVLSKTSPSRSELVNSNGSQKDSLKANDPLISLSKAEKDFQPLLTFSVNGVSSNSQMMLSRRDLLSKSVRPAEEWPDWSESEDLGNEKTGRMQMRPGEECFSMEAQPELNQTDEEPWVDSASSNKGLKAVLDAISVKEPIPTTSLLVEEMNTIKISSSLTPSAVNSVTSSSNDSQDPPNQDKETSKTALKTPNVSQERSLEKNMSTEFGLGEEFTIQVKRKSQDPELDWFADMVPEIKPFTTSLILPDMTEATVLDNVVAVPNQVEPGEENDLQNLIFSSKFAADEITETEAEGWGGADLNWEDESNW